MSFERRPLLPGVKFDIWRRDGFRCRYCGKTVQEEGVILEVDHVIPVSVGGGDEPSNLVTACRDCNRGKADTVAGVESWIFQGWGHNEEYLLEAQQARIAYELAVIAEVRALRVFGTDAASAAVLLERLTGRASATINDLIALAEARIGGARQRLDVVRRERDRLRERLSIPFVDVSADGTGRFAIDLTPAALVRAAGVILTPDEYVDLMGNLLRRLPVEDQIALADRWIDENDDIDRVTFVRDQLADRRGA